MTTTLAPPKSQMCAVLRGLIIRNGISERDFNQNGFRSRLSNLRNDYCLPVQFRIINFVNQYGHPGQYREHYLRSKDRPAAIKLYRKLNSND